MFVGAVMWTARGSLHVWGAASGAGWGTDSAGCGCWAAGAVTWGLP